MYVIYCFKCGTVLNAAKFRLKLAFGGTDKNWNTYAACNPSDLSLNDSDPR